MTLCICRYMDMHVQNGQAVWGYPKYEILGRRPKIANQVRNSKVLKLQILTRKPQNPVYPSPLKGVTFRNFFQPLGVPNFCSWGHSRTIGVP